MKQITDEEASALLALRLLSAELPEQGKLSVEQEAALNHYLDAVPGRRLAVEQNITFPEIITGIQERISESERGERIRNHIQQIIHGDADHKRNSWKVISRLFRLRNIAAIVIISILGYLLVHLIKPHAKEVSIVQAGLIVPMKGKVTLTLSTGDVIALDQRQLSTEDGTTHILNSNGELTYHAGEASPNRYNTLSTGSAQVYKVKLPDGTLVWLNAGTTLKYPVQFSKNERMVEIEGGECFFDVTHSAVPFRVKTGEDVVEVHGTAFNVFAYAGEKKKVSLIRGAVSVFNERQQINLAPGEQVAITSGNIQKSAQADMQEVQAWMNNNFWLDNKTVRQTLSDISRWYGVQIVYEYSGPLLDATLHGGQQVPRDIAANETLEMIAFTTSLKIYYSDRKIIIRK